MAGPPRRDPVSHRYTDSFQLFDFRFRVVSESATARRLLYRLYGAYATSGADLHPSAFTLHIERLATPGARRWRIHDGDARIGGRVTLGLALQELEYAVCVRMIAHRPDLMALHGATVLAAGGACFISGRSGAGKTTLALALAARRYRVGGDDIALIDPNTGAASPVPRCFHLDESSWRLLRDVGLPIPAQALRHKFLTPADLCVTDIAPVTVRHILLVARGSEPDPRLVSLTQAEAELGLLPEADWPGGSAVRALPALGRLVSGAAAYRLTSGRLDATAGAVAALLGPP